ncbi:hypothetical protein SAMN02746066_01679 [Anaerosporobacter mobilis DSM 15930]|jgi:deoxyribodipyrimidine photolyase|uniref:Uncharacterized protein n=1 Tax=Anaerosporobacter mobilis DSM 15930 TaxID=1120996 RepID=A0A1M7I623_9FIRM|nr:hypothetical protein [Anaerosporobacter mobilis]SHM36145.1 hypothetical protein SAMN02746066_01679 [Anaerosporobacter mobilis DSM 15930]
MEQIISDAQSLLQFVEQTDLLMQMDSVQANLLLSELQSSKKQLSEEDSKLYVKESSDSVRTCITIDELIDIACESNYEKLVGTRQKNKRSFGLDQYLSTSRDLLQLQQQEVILHSLFKQTIYGKNMMQVVNQYLTRMQQNMSKRQAR